MSAEDLDPGVENFGRCVGCTPPEVIEYCRDVILESLDYRVEVVVQSYSFFIQPVHPVHGLC